MIALSRPLTLSVVLAVVISTLSPLALADIPKIINYQGKVTDTGGAPVADGDYSMTFTIYDASSGGSSLWSSGAMTVAVSGGVFSAVLGDTGQPTLDLEFDVDYWLAVDIAGDVQSPRQRLGSVGYAYMASGLVAGTEVIGNVNGGAAIEGHNTSTISDAYGLYGRSDSGEGIGVFGWAASTWGETYGGYFKSDAAPYGTGVLGVATATSGTGILGVATATSGTTYGIYGLSSSTDGRGVYGTASASWGATCGVYGTSASPFGTGVYGEATASSLYGVGVIGTSPADSGTGVWGHATSTVAGWGGFFRTDGSQEACAVYGLASSSTGMTYGGYFDNRSTWGTGVYGYTTATEGDTRGIYGRSASTAGEGVFGYVSASTGATRGISGLSMSTEGSGVYGRSVASTGWTSGVYGESASTNGKGVEGYASAPAYLACGVWGESESDGGAGVWGQNNSTGGSGVYYSGGLAGTGSKSCIVQTSQGPTLLYCQESPECWFEDVGGGELRDGRAHIALDLLFLETVTINESNPMRVFIQLHDEMCEGVAVKKGDTGFEVVELRSGKSASTFDYRVMAKRKGFEDKRLDYCKAAENDSYLYPELREKKRRAFGRENARFEEARGRMEKHRTEREQVDEGMARAIPPFSD